MKSKNCLNCLKNFTKNKFTSKKKWEERKFCSRKCVSDFRRGKVCKQKGQFRKGQKSWNKGLTKENNEIVRKYAEKKIGDNNPMKRKEVREKSSLSHRGKMIGELHPNWKGGKSSENERVRKSFEYKIWRSDVFQRDNWTCQTCRIRGTDLEVHHIKSFAHNPESRFDVNNGVTLCKECHNLTKKN